MTSAPITRSQRQCVEDARTLKVAALAEAARLITVASGGDLAGMIAALTATGGLGVSRTGAWVAVVERAHSVSGVRHGFPSDETRARVVAALRHLAALDLSADAFAGLDAF